MSQAPSLLEQLSQVGSAEERHAEEPQTGIWLIMDRMNRNDVSVLEPCEDFRLVSVGMRDLQGDQPPAELDLFCEKDVRERTSAKLDH